MLICTTSYLSINLGLIQVESGPSHDLLLDFDSGFSDWNVRNWEIVHYDSTVARVLNITAMNKSSTAGASPVSRLTNNVNIIQIN